MREVINPKNSSDNNALWNGVSDGGRLNVLGVPCCVLALICRFQTLLRQHSPLLFPSVLTLVFFMLVCSQTPKAKAAVRNSQAKAKALADNFVPLTEPHVDVLVTKKKDLKAFVDNNPELKQVVVRPLEHIVALDSASGKAKWTEPPSKDGSKPAGSMFLKGRNPSRSRTGTDLLMFTAYSEKHQE